MGQQDEFRDQNMNSMPILNKSFSSQSFCWIINLFKFNKFWRQCRSNITRLNHQFPLFQTQKFYCNLPLKEVRQASQPFISHQLPPNQCSPMSGNYINTSCRSKMGKGSISLKVDNLKQLKMGYRQTSFYLTLHTHHQDSVFIVCKNILFEEEPFQVEQLHLVDKIEVWNYDTRKKVATLHLKSEAAGKQFEYAFKKHNMKLAIQWLDPIPLSANSQSLAAEKSDSEESRSTSHNLSAQKEP